MGSIKRSLANNITTGGAFDATDLSGTIPSTNVADASLTNLTTFSPALGDTIESVSSDPVSATEGQFWYNSTSGVLKGLVQLKAWSSTTNLPAATRFLAGAGTQTAGLGFGGNTGQGSGTTGATEAYNGTAWTTSPVSLANAKSYLAGCGTQTAAFAFGGNPITTSTEEYTEAALTTKTVTTS
jgi:hypothetical protein